MNRLVPNSALLAGLLFSGVSSALNLVEPTALAEKVAQGMLPPIADRVPFEPGLVAI